MAKPKVSSKDTLKQIEKEIKKIRAQEREFEAKLAEMHKIKGEDFRETVIESLTIFHEKFFADKLNSVIRKWHMDGINQLKTKHDKKEKKNGEELALKVKNMAFSFDRLAPQVNRVVDFHNRTIRKALEE